MFYIYFLLFYFRLLENNKILMAYRHQSIAEQQLRYENIGYVSPPRNQSPQAARNQSPQAARNQSPPAARNQSPPAARNRSPPSQQAANIPPNYEDCITYKCEIAKLKLELKIAKGEYADENDIDELKAKIREDCADDVDIETFIQRMEIERQVVKLKNEVNTIRILLPFICHFLFLIIGNRKFDGLTNLTELYSVLLYTSPKTVTGLTEKTKRSVVIAKRVAFTAAIKIKDKLNLIIPEFVRFIQRGTGYNQYSAAYLTVFLIILYYIVAGQQISNIDSAKPFSEIPSIANRKATTRASRASRVPGAPRAQQKNELSFVKEKDKAIYRIATTYMNDDDLNDLASIFMDKIKVKMFLKKLKNKIIMNVNELTAQGLLAAKPVGQSTPQSRKEMDEIMFKQMLMNDDVEKLDEAIMSFKKGGKKKKVSKRRCTS
jgi:hypothetical protein